MENSKMLYIYQMSNTATGVLAHENPFRLVLVFDIGGDSYIFSSDLPEPLPDFGAEEVSINYEHLAQLNSSKQFTGTLEGGELKINLEDEVIITATVQPDEDVGPFEGEGSWEVMNDD